MAATSVGACTFDCLSSAVQVVVRDLHTSGRMRLLRGKHTESRWLMKAISERHVTAEDS